MAEDLKAATPDASLPSTGFLFGADSQAAASPSVYTVAAVKSAIVGGSNTQLQYNNNGAFGGTSGFTTDGANGLSFSASFTISISANLFMHLGNDTSNVFLGDQSGNASITGIGNVVLGQFAGGSLTSGSSNVFIGGTAGRFATSPSGAVVIGNAAGGTGAMSGTDMVVIGSSAGASLTTASDNVLLGVSSGNKLTTGANNTALGTSTLINNITGSNNVVVGQNAGQGLTGSGGIAVGFGALSGASTSGASNINIGNNSSITTGTLNSLWGLYAGSSITTGSGNVLLGNQAGNSITTGTGNTVLGGNWSAGSLGVTTGSWNVILGNPSGLATTLSNAIVIADGLSNIRLDYNSTNASAWTFPAQAIFANGALTGSSTPFVRGSQTWNNAATTFVAQSFDVTDTASAALSRLVEWKVGGTDIVYITKQGNINTSGSMFTNGMNIGASSTQINLISGGAVGKLKLRDYQGNPLVSLMFGTDFWLTRKAAASFQLGDLDAAAPVAQTFGVQSVVAGTTNTAGQVWTFKDSVGTGTGASGGFNFQTAPAGTTGTAQNAYADAFKINAPGDIQLAKAFTVSTLPAAGTAGRMAKITDGDASLAWGATAINSGAGATPYLCWDNGTNWTIVGK